MSILLEVKDVKAQIGEKEILKGINHKSHNSYTI